MGIWQLEKDEIEYTIMHRMISKYHKHLQEANIYLYKSDKDMIKGNNIIVAKASKASAIMKATNSSDFNIIIYQFPWSNLNEKQKEACIDHELTHCSVKYVPEKEEINGKKRIAHDEYGRKIFTNEIDRNEEGIPKWTIASHDFEEFRDVIAHHGINVLESIIDLIPSKKE